MSDDQLSGVGQGMTRAKIKPDVAKRIEEIGKLNDRWMDALDKSDFAALLLLARAIRLDVAERQR